MNRKSPCVSLALAVPFGVAPPVSPECIQNLLEVLPAREAALLDEEEGLAGGKPIANAVVTFRRTLPVGDLGDVAGTALAVRLWHEFGAVTDVDGNFAVGGPGGGEIAITLPGAETPVHYQVVDVAAKNVLVRVGSGQAWRARVRFPRDEPPSQFRASTICDGRATPCTAPAAPCERSAVRRRATTCPWS